MSSSSSSSTPVIDPKDFYIHNRSNEIIVRLPGSINGLDLVLEELNQCVSGEHFISNQ